MVDLPPMPQRIARRPRDKRGYPVPWFATIIDGEPDFRVADSEKWALAVRFGRCWVCGEAAGRNRAFLIGPMCAVNRVTSEPGCHLDCAMWSAIACPFLSRPRMRRNEKGLPEGSDYGFGGGFALKRNPGACVVWVTRSWKTFKPAKGAEGVLISLGDPESVFWFTEGHAATYEEAIDALERGVPTLREMCEQEPTARDRQTARLELDRMYAAALQLVPKAA